MTFGTVQSDFLALRRRLSIHVGPTALAEITLEPPKGSDDELSFIRLVSWSYVLIHENGKVSLNFLKQLPPLDQFGKLLPHVRGLRTWMSHNLSLDKTADIKTATAAISWFKRTCGTGTPMTPLHWGKCFSQLCAELSSLLSDAVLACDNLDSPEDGPQLVAELKKRIDLQWDAHLFDPYVEEALSRLGFPGIDVVAFRGKHLDSWRRIVADSEDGARDRLITLRVESDILKAMADALPITLQELLQQVDLSDPTELAAAVILIRAQRGKGKIDLPTLLRMVLEQIIKQHPCPEGVALERPAEGGS